jgi:hypothetical protein
VEVDGGDSIKLGLIESEVTIRIRKEERTAEEESSG